MEYKNIILIGSSHIAKESIELAEKTIEKEKPGIVALELDKDRFDVLMKNKKGSIFMKGVGLKGWLFALIGAWVEKKLGKIVNVEPGAEMKKAIETAAKNKAKIALIDQHIAVTLKRFSKTITWKEKLRFVIDIVSGIFMPNRQLKMIKMKKEDIVKVPSRETIKKILAYTKTRYPNFYNVLVDERNKVMANNLIHLRKTYPKGKIVAIIGAGHEEGIMRILKKSI